MALNLNKSGDEPKKFNLAKSDAAPNVPANNNTNDTKPGKEKKSSKVWLLLLLLLGAGLGIWYFTSTNAASKTEPDANVSNAVVTNTASTNPVSENPATASPSTPPNAVSNTSDNPSANTVTENTKLASENSADKPTTTNTSSKSENTKVANNNSEKHIKVVAYFNAGSSNIASKEEGEVKEILDFLKKNPNGNVTINGYASSEGDPGINQQLSQKRADAFKKFLLGKGISANRIETVGKGSQDPIASNETSEGRSKNRRVEVVR